MNNKTNIINSKDEINYDTINNVNNSNTDIIINNENNIKITQINLNKAATKPKIRSNIPITSGIHFYLIK